MTKPPQLALRLRFAPEVQRTHARGQIRGDEEKVAAVGTIRPVRPVQADARRMRRTRRDHPPGVAPRRHARPDRRLHQPMLR